VFGVNLKTNGVDMDRVKIEKPRRPGTFPPGYKGPGRTKGKPNKVTTLLKDAIILAAEAVGEDRKGKDGLVGYLKYLAKREPKAYASLLSRVLPYHITGNLNHQHEVFQKKEEVIDALRARGIPLQAVYLRGDDADYPTEPSQPLDS